MWGGGVNWWKGIVMVASGVGWMQGGLNRGRKWSLVEKKVLIGRVFACGKMFKNALAGRK